MFLIFFSADSRKIQKRKNASLSWESQIFSSARNDIRTTYHSDQVSAVGR